MKYKCPCCGYYTFSYQPNGNYDICPICFWEDDPQQLANENLASGANKVSFRQARQNFIKFGACEKEMLVYVRKPIADEKVEQSNS